MLPRHGPSRQTSSAAPWGGWTDTRLGWAAVVLVALLALGRLWWLPAHAPLNINEGWNAGHVARVFGPGTLYPPPDALIGNNYPPLSFFLVGLAERMVGDAIVAGRIVSLLAQVATGWVVFAVVRRLTGDPRWATAGALLFAGYGVTLLRGYLAMNDPQWLAQAATAGALVLLVPAVPGERLPAWRVLAAAAFAVAGGLIKHNAVALPAALTLWLWVADRRAFALWAGAGLALAAAACATLYAIWGADVFADVLAPARSYSLARMAAHGVPLLLAVLPTALAARPLAAAWAGDRRLLLPPLMLALAVLNAVAQRSGDGVDVNPLFDVAVALAIMVPAACARRREDAARWLGVAALPALALAPVAFVKSVSELIGREAAVRHWAPFVAAVRRADGPVACDDQAVCHWAGRQSALDFFAWKQRLLKGDGPVLTAALDAHAFALVAMRGENRGWHENRLIPAIRARYRTLYADGGYELLVPRDSSASRSRIAGGSATVSRP